MYIYYIKSMILCSKYTYIFHLIVVSDKYTHNKYTYILHLIVVSDKYTHNKYTYIFHLIVVSDKYTHNPNLTYWCSLTSAERDQIKVFVVISQQM